MAIRRICRTAAILCFAAAAALAFFHLLQVFMQGYASRSDTGIYANEWPGFGVAFLASLFLALPLLGMYAAWRRPWWLAWVATTLYAGLALLFGFGIGGPHLLTGVPSALLGAILLTASLPWDKGKEADHA